jgi:hypothetical protein
MVAAELETMLRAHQPDDAGLCATCRAEGTVELYPCTLRLVCEQAAAALERRRASAGVETGAETGVETGAETGAETGIERSA